MWHQFQLFLISFMLYNSINFSGHNPTITGTKFYILIRRSESRKRAVELPRFACSKSFFKSEACLIQMNIKNIISRNFFIPNSFINFVLASRRTTVEAPLRCEGWIYLPRKKAKLNMIIFFIMSRKRWKTIDFHRWLQKGGKGASRRWRQEHGKWLNKAQEVGHQRRWQ